MRLQAAMHPLAVSIGAVRKCAFRKCLALIANDKFFHNKMSWILYLGWTCHRLIQSISTYRCAFQRMNTLKCIPKNEHIEVFLFCHWMNSSNKRIYRLASQPGMRSVEWPLLIIFSLLFWTAHLHNGGNANHCGAFHVRPTQRIIDSFLVNN